MVCTGAKSETDSRLAARKYARIIQKLGFNDARFQDFKIQNIVGSCDVSFPVRLEGLQHKHSIFARYEPELFPGLIYRMKKPKIVLLIFVSGKVVLTGAKHRDEIYQAFEMIYPALLEFRKGDAQKLARQLAGGLVSSPDLSSFCLNATLLVTHPFLNSLFPYDASNGRFLQISCIPGIGSFSMRDGMSHILFGEGSLAICPPWVLDDQSLVTLPMETVDIVTSRILLLPARMEEWEKVKRLVLVPQALRFCHSLTSAKGELHKGLSH